MSYAGRCPDTVNGAHGPLDRAGRCPWCDRKVGAALPMPSEGIARSDLSEYYDLFFDPDYSADNE
jgi:hypothetical protein